jgi:hypothetical protein
VLSGSRSSRVAWALWALTCLLLACIWVLIVLHRSVPKDVAFVLPRLAGSILVLSTGTVGALIASRCPNNPIGWMFCAAALVWDIGAAATEYAIFAVVEVPGKLPAGNVAVWLSAWVLVPSGLCLVFLLLLFPTGRLPSDRWKPVGWAAVAGILVVTVAAALTPGPISTTLFEAPPNPFGLSGMPWIRNLVVPGILVTLTCAVAAATSLVSRLRKARSLERQQLKWFAAGGILVISSLAGVWVPMWASGTSISSASGLVIAAAGVAVLAAIPVTTGVAILRYRLYDIDVIINRTLVYGSLTTVLAGVFAALSILTQRVVLAMTGQESQAAVVLAALVVTALFQPLRARVQIVVDRHFYRRKYDTAQTLERFASQVRDKFELDQLTTELVAVVRETMQPSHASLWLPPPHDARATEMGDRP